MAVTMAPTKHSESPSGQPAPWIAKITITVYVSATPSDKNHSTFATDYLTTAAMAFMIATGTFRSY